MLPLQLRSLPATTERKLPDFFLNNLERISQEDSRACIAPTHLKLEPLQGWKHFTMDTTWLSILKSLGDISGHSEIRILVNTLWDQTKSVLGLPENVWECVA
jgi:hypothetical protein